jgi:dTDP-glucose pyrophosphorylase
MLKLTLTEITTFSEAVQLLDKNGNGFLPVIDPDGKLLGILTDGDIRRAILREERDVRNMINTSPTVALSSESRMSIVKRLHALKRRHMPVVDERGYFVDVVVLNDFNERVIENRVVIMAGGLGSRLGELTKDIPKPMLKVSGRPILQRILESFRNAGFHNFTLCLNYKSGVIKDYFGNGSEFGIAIDYTLEHQRMGTAGALSLIDRDKLAQSFIVTNGDILTSLNFEDFLDTHNKYDSVATMCVKQYSMQLPYANIISDEEGNLISLEEKPMVPFYINAGIYALSPNVLPLIPPNEYFDMTTLLSTLREQKHTVRTFKMDDYWIDIGQPGDFIRANEENGI